MVPITSLYAALAALLMLFLAFNVVRLRLSTGVMIGEGEQPGFTNALRAHGNAVEYLPTGLILMLCLELEHGSLVLLHAIGVLLIVGRVAHMAGLLSSTGRSLPRAAGFSLTVVALLVAAIALLLRVAMFAPALTMAH